MGDLDNKSVSFQGAQADPAKGLPQADPGKGADDKPITPTTDHLLETISTEVGKQVQGWSDRITAHIDKRFDGLGKPAPIASDNPPVGNQINSPEQIKAAAAAELVTQMGIDAMQEVGIQVLNNDPEAQLIDTSSPSKYVASCKAAAEKKKQRVETPSAGRLAGVPGGQYENEDAEALSNRLAELQKEPTKNIDERKKIREKLASLNKK